MEVVTALALLCALALLAARWGCDSRPSLRSKEQELAALGFTWGPPAPSPTTTAHLPVPLSRLLRRHRPSEGALGMQAWNASFELERASERLAEHRRAAEMWRLARLAANPRRSYRSRLAGLLTAMANWLDPETARTTNDSVLLGLVGGSPERGASERGWS